MKWKRSGFLRHYRKIRIEGLDLSSMINKCIGNGIDLRNLRWKDELQSTVEVKDEDFDRLRKLAGHSYKMTVVREGGAIPFFRTMKADILTVTGAFLLGALIFYQSLFVAEIRVDGYEKLTETAIRETLSQAGLYEGVRIEEDYSHVKAALYENHEEITWASIFTEGRLVKVTIAEAGNMDEAEPPETEPADIVAARSGMIESVTPLQGNAVVEKGEYVNKGDVLISGAYEYQSSDYSKGDEVFTMYSHARGQAMAKVPRTLTYYLEKNERIKKPTGKSVFGIYMKLGDIEFDTADAFCRFEASVRDEALLIDAVRPLPISVGVVRIDEVKLAERPRDTEMTEDVMAAVIRQYAADELEEGEEITQQSIDYYESVNVIRADVFLEVLEDIGTEKQIKVKDKEKNKEETSAE